jgi:hypothetical protein
MIVSGGMVEGLFAIWTHRINPYNPLPIVEDSRMDIEAQIVGCIVHKCRGLDQMNLAELAYPAHHPADASFHELVGTNEDYESDFWTDQS